MVAAAGYFMECVYDIGSSAECEYSVGSAV